MVVYTECRQIYEVLQEAEKTQQATFQFKKETINVRSTSALHVHLAASLSHLSDLSSLSRAAH